MFYILNLLYMFLHGPRFFAQARCQICVETESTSCTAGKNRCKMVNGLHAECNSSCHGRSVQDGSNQAAFVLLQHLWNKEYQVCPCIFLTHDAA